MPILLSQLVFCSCHPSYFSKEARHHKGLKCVRCSELPAVMKCSFNRPGVFTFGVWGRISQLLAEQAISPCLPKAGNFIAYPTAEQS